MLKDYLHWQQPFPKADMQDKVDKGLHIPDRTIILIGREYRKAKKK